MERSSPFLTMVQGSIPIDRILRTTWLGSLFKGEVEAALATAAGGINQVSGQLVLPVPTMSDTKWNCLDVAFISSMVSRRATPVGTLS